ncbi:MULTISPECIES: MFS transporter [Actinotignum]|uniref:MFS transporter n=3 Tax=Actinotignum TaxID=1653174 RepID=A0AAW9HED2_9ACTO|nr:MULTISPECIES: MFS transporter [Actinotignum]MBS5749092.1 MFS transporter [Actinotignum schaalii]MDE1536606.1 MFS transporter [Actinotignum schaalii]MDE1558374.1 MFS transporter [Actinotignum schaalii]MDE1663166.1 MFS transporter [Actinotignum schaalii]MDK6372481.1 MFS transporter [Actinotignum timonense]
MATTNGAKAPAGTAQAGTAPAGNPPQETGYRGTEKLLWGIVLAVVTFWLFAGTAATVAPNIMEDLGNVDAAGMNLAVSITGLFSGLFMVLMGGLADKIGRVRITLLGIVLNAAGSLLLIFAAGGVALPLLLTGRAIQGLGAACIMPASMALVKAYWDGPARQRAVSMWSIGSWGGSGLAAIFGGTVVQFVGWRGIFIASIIISVLAFLMILGTPENRVESTGPRKSFDAIGLVLFIAGTLGLMIVLLYGSKLGWGSAATLLLTALAVVSYALFFGWERKQANPFIDFALFKNTTFTGATISNFLVNGTIGMLIISQQVIQLAGHKADGSLYTAFDAGLLSLGYGVCIIAFIRIGEKLLQRFGPRKPMIWGCLITIVACGLLMTTHLLIGQYVLMAVIAYCLFGLGLAFYATPSTDAALSNLPASQAGSGSGIYKMASSLGGAIGTAISLAVFYGLQGAPVPDVIAMSGRTDNSSIRLAAMVALGVSLVFLLLAIVSITTTVPKGGGSATAGASAPSAAPAPQLAPDDERQEIIARLSELPLRDLQRLERQLLVDELSGLDTKALQALVEKQKA